MLPKVPVPAWPAQYRGIWVFSFDECMPGSAIK